MNVAARFETAIAAAEQALSAISEGQASHPARPGGWLRKEELGHLLDSAQNNHQRIALAAINSVYTGPEYAQNAWVDLHGYRSMEWAEILAFWKMRNQMLHRVITNIPEERLSAWVRIGDSPAMTLSAWIDDYLQHMAHHVAQMTDAL
ncbi:MAG TPA: DinB family protein [Paludibaculum sp.]|jgi:hypothetical protein